MHKSIATLAGLLFIALSPMTQSAEQPDAKAPERNYNLNENNQASTEEAAKPYTLNVKGYGLTPEVFQKIAVKAFLKYHWKIETNEVTRLQGSYAKFGRTYKSEIRFTGDKIVIEYVPGAQSDNRKWLRSLANYVKSEVGVFRRETETQQYLKK